MRYFRELCGCCIGALLTFAVEQLITSRTLRLKFLREQPRRIKTKRANQNNASTITVYIHSGPALSKGREFQRRYCIPTYRERGINAMFVIARPSFDNRPHNAHAQGQYGTKRDIDLSKSLLRESKKYGDMLFLSHRDYYRDMTDKMLGYFRHDYKSVQSDFLFKTDDEYCLDIDVMMKVIHAHKSAHPSKELYTGTFLFHGTEYASMKGPHGEIAPFMSGAALGVSKGLVKNIVHDNWGHSALYHSYGTSSDDANLGKWIKFANETDGLQTQYVEADLKYELPTQIRVGNFNHNFSAWASVENMDISRHDIYAGRGTENDAFRKCAVRIECASFVLLEGRYYLKSTLNKAFFTHRKGSRLWLPRSK